MRVVTGDEVHRICDWRALVTALKAAHGEGPPLVAREMIQSATPDGQTDTYINLAAWQPGRAMGSKLITVLPDNPDRNPDLPAIQAVFVLFDGATGSPRAVIDGTALTYRKTAADSALGSDLLAGRDARVMAMIGAGGLAPYLVEAHRAVRPGISQVRVWNRRPAKAEALAAQLRARGVDARAEADAEAAVRGADLVSCATSATEPIVRGGWLKAGAHIDLVGGYLPQMRECDDETVLRARLFVDSRMFAVDKPGDLADPIARGVIGADKVEADLFELCAPGAQTVDRRPGDVTLFKNGGGAHLDLFTALFIAGACGA
ncbi:MAG: ornithine cyclodeaminase [Hyphomicrobiaceae bacterium]